MSLPKEIEGAAAAYAGGLPMKFVPQFMDGVRWLYSRLTSASGEFDEQLAAVKCREFRYASTHYACIEGARFQHSVDAARTGALFAQSASAILSLERENAALRETLRQTADGLEVMTSGGNALAWIGRANSSRAEADRIRDERASACTCGTARPLCPLHLTPYPEEQR